MTMLERNCEKAPVRVALVMCALETAEPVWEQGRTDAAE
jgi:hypothetical protein